MADARDRRAIFYVLRAGSPGGDARQLSALSTVYRWFARLRDDGTWETINHYLVTRDREGVGREASPRRHHGQPKRQNRPKRRRAGL